jgi:hypothetical protein
MLASVKAEPTTGRGAAAQKGGALGRFKMGPFLGNRQSQVFSHFVLDQPQHTVLLLKP